MNKIGERIRDLRLKKRLSQKDLAKNVGVSPTAISQWEREEYEPRGKNLSKLSKALGTTVDYLTAAVQPPIKDFTVQPCVLVSFYPEVNAAGGAGSYNDHENLEYTPLPNNVLNNHNINDVSCIKLSGDSMSPVVPDGALIAFDRSESQIYDGKMYVFRHNGLLRMKCLKQTSYDLIIHSHNPEYSDEIYALDQLCDFEIIGRVFWYSTEV
ncbi:peptidase S24 [Vibrio parahaemolyticus]|uniref:XRE family transcriptional regulator n=1 Tax=Vibrio parahaemolyticus TaxID=670 RepID=UPI001124A9F8|nr:S24 family peptidase [Vibrio parahaemolyticus]MDF4820353.1 S24 family peptidase [Vibrio parahaemolyticus]TOR11919.1 peptidase S24 [Vibrio parahaemolyticus]UJW92767.1 helix-turn-helix transcriptional regulator [Vibrio parahaemolyticus]UJX06932.1 helix-turn-helix transcriptional regulator [Vibrio parahaemolyticus]UJX07008.1 helix-turn-helix transcriptional regulator [Vibrio parahaemolyticus]